MLKKGGKRGGEGEGYLVEAALPGAPLRVLRGLGASGSGQESGKVGARVRRASGWGKRQQEADRQGGRGEGERPVALPPPRGVREENLLAPWAGGGPRAPRGSALPWGTLEGSGCFGGSQVGPDMVWNGYCTPDRGQGRHKPGARGLESLPSPSVPRPAWDSRKETFSWLFFFSPSSPILGTATPPDVTAFLGEGHVVP